MPAQSKQASKKQNAKFNYYLHLLLSDDVGVVAIAKVDDYFGFRHYCYCYCVKWNRVAVQAVYDDVLVQLVAFHAPAKTMDHRPYLHWMVAKNHDDDRRQLIDVQTFASSQRDYALLQPNPSNFSFERVSYDTFDNHSVLNGVLPLLNRHLNGTEGKEKESERENHYYLSFYEMLCIVK